MPLTEEDLDQIRGILHPAPQEDVATSVFDTDPSKWSDVFEYYAKILDKALNDSEELATVYVWLVFKLRAVPYLTARGRTLSGTVIMLKLAPWSDDVPVAPTRLFVVETGHRDRGVVDLRDFNAECGGSISEPASIREVMFALRNKGHHSVGQLDLTRAYYSIRFTVAEGAAYPAFYYRDKVYRFTRLPMGWVHSSRVLGICVRDLLDSTPVKEGCIRRVYADNLCYSSPLDEITRAAMQGDRDALNNKGFLIKDEAFEVLDNVSSIKMLGYVVYREDGVTRLKCKERSLPLVTNRRSLLSIAGKAYDELGIIGAGAYKGALCSMAGTGVTPARKRESMMRFW
ncbi:hypothetical protein FOZ61_010944 [Perkinsus olseni]|uniref:Reverse transcriptase domain-containing protein n=1 Tax=Perkinsus olseni TaxID=32597 RepID=A0A7J6MK35_PEROL|nr:hypothetical protein FOZ61_010944 [Perkinsus olseni]KAF4671806.1 hypothetical protein FOL46_009890 [Perkinsus olseni]